MYHCCLIINDRKGGEKMDGNFYVGWGTLALINAGIAQGKNRTGLNWFLLSLLLGPLATLILLFVEKRRVWKKYCCDWLCNESGIRAAGNFYKNWLLLYIIVEIFKKVSCRICRNEKNNNRIGKRRGKRLSWKISEFTEEIKRRVGDKN